MDAALDLAEAGGIGGITTASLAHKLGFTEAALYRYFSGKDAIIAAAMQNLAERVFTTMLLELVPSNVAGHEPETQLSRHVLRFTYRSGLLLELLMHAAGGRDSVLLRAGHGFLDKYDQRMRDYFHQLQAAEMIPSALPPGELARLWTCQILGGFVRVRLTGETWDPAAQPGFAAFLAGLRVSE